jgi:hypothetical protein
MLDTGQSRVAGASGRLLRRRVVQPETIRHYLSLGFLPDAEVAADYVHGLLAAPPCNAPSPADLLIEIVHDLTEGSDELAIPLTAGNDSRGLLGAALALFPAHKVHCFTFGPENFEDVRGARAACRAVGVDHVVVDPNRIEWSMPAIQREMERRLRAGLGLAPIDGLAVFGGLASAIPEGLPVLSGFLGDAVSGRHLAGDSSDNDPDCAVRRFYRRNPVVFDDYPHALFYDFLTAHEGLKADWPGLTTYDLLDLGFRQCLRIRSVTTAAFTHPIAPYEDPRWVGYWFSRPLHRRIRQRSYRRSLHSRFATLFPQRSYSHRLGNWISRQGGRLSSAFHGSASRKPWIAERGDPRRNGSMAAVLEEACRNFDQRGLAAPGAGVTAFEKLMREPSRAAFLTARWFASAEILARASEGLDDANPESRREQLAAPVAGDAGRQ